MNLKAIDDLLHISVRVRHAIMLTQMLGPGGQHKGFHKTTLSFGIFKNLPVECPVTATFSRQMRDSVEKRLSIARFDLILDRY